MASEVRRRQQAEQELQGARAAQQSVERELDAVARGERARLEQGQATVADLRAASEFESGARSQLETHASGVLVRAARLNGARRDESAAISRMVRAENSVEAVERHRKHWALVERRRVEDGADEAVADVAAPASRQKLGRRDR